MVNKYQDIINELNRLFPDAKCELNFNNDFELLIAVLLSAQTTDKAVNNVTKDLFLKYKNPIDYVRININDLENDIKRIGLYHNKAKNIKKLSEIIHFKYNDNIPSTRKELELLPGVGRKTANVVLSNAFNVPAIAVDTHVERVSKRLKLAYNNDSVLKVEQKLMNKFDKKLWTRLHHQFVLFGRYQCKAINPNCKECNLKKYCRYKLK